MAIDIRRLVARMDLDQKIGQIHGVVPMDLVDFAKFTDPTQPVPDLSKGFPYEIERLPLVRPHGVGHLSLGWQLDQDLAALKKKFGLVEVDRETFVRQLKPSAKFFADVVRRNGYDEGDMR